MWCYGITPSTASKLTYDILVSVGVMISVGFSLCWVTMLKNIRCPHLGLYSQSEKTSYRKISWSLEAARFEFKLFQSLLPRCLSNFRAIRPLQHPISRLRDFTRFDGKTSYRLLNRGPGGLVAKQNVQFVIMANNWKHWMYFIVMSVVR